jgi:hypothetical protein
MARRRSHAPQPPAPTNPPRLTASPAHRRRRPNHPRCRRHRPRCARHRAGRRHPCRRWSSGGRAGCSAAASLSQSTSRRDEPQAAACAPPCEDQQRSPGRWSMVQPSCSYISGISLHEKPHGSSLVCHLLLLRFYFMYAGKVFDIIHAGQD